MSETSCACWSDLRAPRGTIIDSGLGPAKGPACDCCSICCLHETGTRQVTVRFGLEPNGDTLLGKVAERASLSPTHAWRRSNRRIHNRQLRRLWLHLPADSRRIVPGDDCQGHHKSPSSKVTELILEGIWSAETRPFRYVPLGHHFEQNPSCLSPASSKMAPDAYFNPTSPRPKRSRR
jgi:hypothetical protein